MASAFRSLLFVIPAALSVATPGVAAAQAPAAPSCLIVGEGRLVNPTCDFKDGFKLYRTRVQTSTEERCQAEIAIDFVDPGSDKAYSAIATRRGVVLETCAAPARDIRAKPSSAARPKPLSQRGERELPREYTDWLPGQDPVRIDQLSRQIVEHVLADAFNLHTDEPLPVAVRIQRALARVTDLRDRPGGSLNLQLRNAEYYLHGLYAEVAKDWTHWLGAEWASQYDKVKKHFQDTPVDTFILRRTKGNPTSPPGGAPWAAAGMRDGKAIENREVANRPQGHGLKLTELYK